MSSIDNKMNPLDGLSIKQKDQAKKSSGDMGQEEFMKLMLAQLKHQDPMQPMENGEFLAQIAQFSTVTGIDELKGSFDTFASSMQSNQALQASTLVGREVLIPANNGFLTEGGAIQGSLELPASASQVTLNIYGSNGQWLGNAELGPQAAGSVAFSWDGKLADGNTLPPGNYMLEPQAVIDGQNEGVEMMITARVDSVTLGRGGQAPTLNLADYGPTDFSSVREIR